MAGSGLPKNTSQTLQLQVSGGNEDTQSFNSTVFHSLGNAYFKYNISPNLSVRSEFGGRGDINIEQAHLDLYEEGDQRISLFFSDETGISRSGKWNNIFGNIAVVRLAEMYLTRAEGNFEEGTIVGATPSEDLNTVRNRVGLDDLTQAEIDKESILLERKLEVAFEGQMLHDIKRTQQNVGALSFDDPSLVYPIPQREIDVNPELTQNTRYGAAN